MEASWLLELVFADFSIYSCYLGHEFCYFGVPNLSFGRPAASILPPWGPFCQLGDTLGAMEGHIGAQNQMTESTLRSDWSCSGKALAF